MQDEQTAKQLEKEAKIQLKKEERKKRKQEEKEAKQLLAAKQEFVLQHSHAITNSDSLALFSRNESGEYIPSTTLTKDTLLETKNTIDSKYIETNLGFISISQQQDFRLLDFDRIVKSKKCKVYSQIPFENYTNKEEQKSISQFELGFAKKNDQFAVIENIEQGTWYKVVFDPKHCQNEQIRGKVGYVESYLTGRAQNIQNLQFQFETVESQQIEEELNDHAELALKGKNRQHKSNIEKRLDQLVKTKNVYDPHIQTYVFHFPSIGIFHSCFPEKNGTPRQGNLAPFSKGKLVLTIPNAAQSIEGLEEFSHLWLVFVFHLNPATRFPYNHPKIKPPRLDGQSVGLYSTRTPHRLNPIGLTCARIEKIEKNVIYLSGVDLVDSTPIIDIKPYISHYDSFGKNIINQKNNEEFSASNVDFDQVKMPNWINEKAPEERIASKNIEFEEVAMQSLQSKVPQLEYFSNLEDIKQAIIHVIRTDPRPSFLKGKYQVSKKLYGFRIDKLNIRCEITEDETGQESVVIKMVEWYE